MNLDRAQKFVAGSLLMVLAGCGMVGDPPPSETMVEQDVVGDRTVQYLLAEPGAEIGFGDAVEVVAGDSDDQGAEDEEEYNFLVRVCDIGADHQAANCENSTVLRSVGFGGGDEEGESAERRVTTMFWYDADTLYIGYTEQPEVTDGLSSMVGGPEPKLMKCSIRSDNRVDCSDQSEANDRLMFTEED